MNTSTTPNNTSDLATLRDWVMLVLGKWQWFVISFVICFIAMYVYVNSLTPQYTRTALMLIKEGSHERGSLNNVMQGGSAFSFMGNNTAVENEMVVLRAPAIISNVVEELDLCMNYSIDEFHGMRTAVLYGPNMPFDVKIEGLESSDWCSFDLEYKGGGKLLLTRLTYKNDTDNTEKTFNINGKLKVSFGTIAVAISPRYEISKLSDMEGKKIHVRRISHDAAVDVVTRRFGVSKNAKENTVINLTYVDASPIRAEEVLNMIIKKYGENWINDKNQLAISTAHFIDERLKVIQNELGEVDGDISSYKSSNLLLDVQSTGSNFVSKANEAYDRVLTLNTELYMVRYVRKFIVDPAHNSDLLPANAGISNSSIESMIAEYNKMMLERNRIQTSAGSRNQILADMDKQLEAMRLAIVSSIDNHINSLNKLISTYEQEEIKSKSQISNNPHMAKHLLSIERQQKIKETIYMFLLQKREENELSKTFTAYNTRIIAPPSGSRLPSSPIALRLYLIALALALGIPLGIIYFRETLNTTVRGRKDLETVSIPFVGEIPNVTRKNIVGNAFKKGNDNYEIMVKDNGHDIINDAFRVVRANLEFVQGTDKQKNCLMLTSSNPGSGKTFVTANLAMSFAVKGKRVVAVDADLRRTTLSHYVGKPKIGLSLYLGGSVDDWHDIVQKGTLHPNLDVVPVGVVPPNSSELLASERFAKMIEELKKDYDYVFIDCPPVEILADAFIVAGLVDMTIFVIRSGLFEREMIPLLQKYQDENKLHNMSILLNGTELLSSKYGYRYGYHYGYHRYGYNKDGYGYGQEKS